MRGRLNEHAVVYDVARGVETAVRSNPETTAAIAVGAIVVLVALFALVRWLRRPMGVRLRRALGRTADVAVVMHPNPDPDAMACAIGIAHLAESVGTPATIYFSGQIRHQENRAFRNVLDLEFHQIEAANQIGEEAVVLVDHNRPRGFRDAESVTPYAVVDHHLGEGEGTAFTDVRTEYGACASIVAEYYEELGAVLQEHDAAEVDADTPSLTLTRPIATGLLYGIQADTKQLTNGCTEADFHASAYLYPAVDEDRLDRIANPQVSAEVFDVRANAIKNRDVRGPFVLSDVGEVTDADAIPQAADELVDLEGVTAVVVYGQREGTIHLSGRSRDDRIHMGRTLQSALDSVPMASAGGHARMGGGQVPVEYLVGIGPSGTSHDLAFEDLQKRLFEAMTGDV